MNWLLTLPTVFAAALALVTPAILRALPAPVDEPDGDPYGALATPRLAVAVFVLVAAAANLAAVLAPAVAPAWLGLAGPAVLAAVVDARTGYLPKRLVWASWGLTAAGLLVLLPVAGPMPLLRAAAGGAAAAALFWGFWRFGSGFGFGDVRLAPVVGASAAAVSWPLLFGALLLGSLFGLGWGLTWRASGRGQAFPYGPALVAGPFLALVTTALLPDASG